MVWKDNKKRLVVRVEDDLHNLVWNVTYDLDMPMSRFVRQAIRKELAYLGFMSVEECHQLNVTEIHGYNHHKLIEGEQEIE